MVTWVNKKGLNQELNLDGVKLTLWDATSMLSWQPVWCLYFIIIIIIIIILLLSRIYIRAQYGNYATLLAGRWFLYTRLSLSSL